MKTFSKHPADGTKLIVGKMFTALCLATVTLLHAGCSPDAQLNRGKKYYKDGKLADAVKWFRKAAERGHAEAQFALGACYCDGEGVEKNQTEAVKWFRKAAEQGQKEAQFYLGQSYYNGDGIEKNRAEAVKWWRKSAEQGQKEAQFYLGQSYYSGDGIEKNHAEAVKWWRAAAEQGIVKAQFNLGGCYYTGIGIPKDRGTAVQWWRKAAEKGDTNAKFNLGMCYRNGDGVDKNVAKAVQWWREAASEGNVVAAKILQKPWAELRSKGVLGVRFGMTFNPGESEGFALRLDICTYYKLANYSRPKGGWADVAGVSITPKSHKIFRIIGIVENKKEFSTLKSLLEDKYFMTMKKYEADDNMNMLSDLYDYHYIYEELSIRIYSHPFQPDVFVVFTDSRLEKLAKQEAGGKSEFETSWNETIEKLKKED